MKTLLSFFLGLMLSAAFFSGQPNQENIINMEEVTSIETTAAGVMFTFSDGTGYWWEY